jgi:hypothetical protein
MPSSTRLSPPNPPHGSGRERRILFLDDDPQRAEIFLEANPGAVWVQTVAECLARLEEGWDEVHLDHDLGGERYVDLSREDCGMAIVRWLCLAPHPHLKSTRFYIHSHNADAASMMVMQMFVSGFQVESRPFGSTEPVPPPQYPLSENHSERKVRFGWLRRLLDYLSGRQPRPKVDPECSGRRVGD